MGRTSCERASEILKRLVSGTPSDATPDELAELAELGVLVTVDAGAVAWVRDLAEVSARRGLTLGGSPAEDAGRLKEALDDLTEKLGSDLHRMSTRDAVLREEELDRARLRRLVGVMADPAQRALLETASKAGDLTGSAPLVPMPGGNAIAVTGEGRRTAEALSPRLARYAKAPLSHFLEKHRQVESRLAVLAQDRRKLEEKAGNVKKPYAVALGLLKLGVSAKEAMRTYDEARGAARFGPQQQLADVAVACARGRRPGESMRETAERLQQAQKVLLARNLGSADVVRGAAKSLLPFPDLKEAASRFAQIHQLVRERLTRLGDDSVRMTARLVGAEGAPHHVMDRVDAAMRILLGPGGPRIGISMPAVVLAAATSTLGELPAAIARLQAITEELEMRDAFGGTPPPALADLVSYKGEPAEVAELVAETARHLMGVPELPPGWLLTADGELAMGLAKRYAY